MTIKNNLRAGIGSLFLLALISSAIATYYIYQLSENSKAILRNNETSIEFTKNINKVLDVPGLPDSDGLKTIEYNIKREEGDITEPGEKALADSLYADFRRFRASLSNPTLADVLRVKMQKSSYGIMEVNMSAMEKKNKKSQYFAHLAISIFVFYLLHLVIILIVLLFLIIFPGYITKPILQLTKGVKEIANKNYDKRLSFTHRIKFWDLAEAFLTRWQPGFFVYENSNQGKNNARKTSGLKRC